MTAPSDLCAREWCGHPRSQHHGPGNHTGQKPCYGASSYVRNSGYGCEINCPAFVPPADKEGRK